MTRKELLNAAEAIVCSDREAQYGSPEDNFGTIAALWTAYKKVDFDAKDVAMMQALLKIARIGTGAHKDDNYIDLAGYAACGAEVASKQTIAEAVSEIGQKKSCLNCIWGSPKQEICQSCTPSSTDRYPLWEMRSCENCSHIHTLFPTRTAPCNECDNLRIAEGVIVPSRWERRKSPVTPAAPYTELTLPTKKCIDCKHLKTPILDASCLVCFTDRTHPNWEPAEQPLSDKECRNCKYLKTPIFDTPCLGCVANGARLNWEPAEQGPPKEEPPRKCTNCAHWHIDIADEPCLSCLKERPSCPNWTPTDSTAKE